MHRVLGRAGALLALVSALLFLAGCGAVSSATPGNAATPTSSGDTGGTGGGGTAGGGTGGGDTGGGTTGTGALVTLSPTSLNFGSVTVGTTSAAKTVSLTNSGDATLTISLPATISAGFSNTTTCGTSLSAGATCTFSITFSPSSATASSGALTITSSVGSNSVTLTGTGVSSGGGGSTGIQAVNHIIFMFQENRSFDNVFGKMNAYRVSLGLSTDVDDLPANASSLSADGTGTVAAFHLKTMCVENTSPAWYESHADFNPFDLSSDTPFMNGFVMTAAGNAIYQGSLDTQGLRAMGYYDANDLPYRYHLAAMFGMSDRWFSPVPTGTIPNLLYAMGGTSYGFVHFPGPTTRPNIFQLLQEKGISWKVYEPFKGQAMVRLYQPFATTYDANIVPMDQYFTDLQNGTLPQVAMIEAWRGGLDEHPGGVPQDAANYHIQKGVAWTAKIINALMQSQHWKDSVFVLSFDEAGGMYDHVPSPTNVPSPDGIPPRDLFTTPPADPPGDFTRYGFRLPLVVVSPFAKAHYVSHTVTDHTSILKFIEKRFGLANLTLRDAAAPDMLEFFDFANPPWKVPPQMPVQPTNGPCYDALP